MKVDDALKFYDVISRDYGMPMTVMPEGQSKKLIFLPLLNYQNGNRSDLSRGFWDKVPSVAYGSRPRWSIDSRVWQSGLVGKSIQKIRW